jgi:glycosyltransferase involved in cell wall biosynthesis
VSAAPKPEDDDCFRLLSAGSLIKVKGFGLAIKAFNEFARRNPNCSLSIVGSGPDETHLRNIVHQAQLESKVRFLGWMSRSELRSEMASCDVFLFPSLRDGGGGVVIEAMAAGKPVVCLDLSGPGMHVTTDCGVKINPGPPGKVVQDLATALEHLYQDGELRQKLGNAARERVQTAYHWDKLGKRLMEYYDLSLNSKGADRVN